MRKGLLVGLVATLLGCSGGSGDGPAGVPDSGADMAGEAISDVISPDVPADLATPDVAVLDMECDGCVGDLVVEVLDLVGGEIPDVLLDVAEVSDVGDLGPDIPLEPVPWSAEATKVTDELKFINVDGKPFFSLGIHAGTGLVYDGVTGPGECDKSTGKGYLDINEAKHLAAAEAGANLVYLWGFSESKAKLIKVQPQFKGNYNTNWGTIVPLEEDIIPIFYNGFGETDLDGFSEAKVQEMKDSFAEFMARTGKFSPENMPTLPPVDQVGHMAWHPTWRMIGSESGEGEMLSYVEVEKLAKATNMMIADAYTFIENRFDLSIPGEAIMAAIQGQKGDKGENYDYWVENDDPEHAQLISTGFMLADSIRKRSDPETVIWMWVQGYSFGNSITKGACEGQTTNDSWATGGMPHLNYMKKEITSMVAAGATGIIFFGFPDTRWDEAEIMFKVFRALSHVDVYEPALLSPKLDVGVDTLYMGETGHLGFPRAHFVTKWHEASKTAYVIGANPGGRETFVSIPFPWSLAKVEILDWENPGFVDAPDVIINNTHLQYTMPKDAGVIFRVTPLMD